MKTLHQSLAALASRKQFILYKTQPSQTRPGKTDKIPCSMRGIPVSWTNPDNLLTAQEACDNSELTGLGIGFVFTEQDPFFVIDIDNCLDPVTNTWTPLAQDIMRLFLGAAMEISQSGRGIHIIATGQSPRHKCKNLDLGIEFYTAFRFIALTGNQACGDASIDHTGAVYQFIEKYLLTGDSSTPTGDLWERWSIAMIELPHPACTPIQDDAELIAKMLSSKSVASLFATKATFSDLWTNNEAVLTQVYLNKSTGEYDRSSADAALAQMLAFWTGNHAERIERLMEQSELNRDKYGRADYLPRTILFARGKQTTFYNSNHNVQLNKNTSGVDITGSMGNSQTLPPLSKMPIQREQYGELTQAFKPANSINNLKQLLNYYEITAQWNDMSHLREIHIPLFNPHPGDSENATLCKIIDLCSHNNLPVTRIDEQLNVIAQENTYHPIVKAVLEKPWDGVPRLNNFIKTVKTKNDAVSHPLIRTWMIAAIAGPFSPQGLAYQGILVLQGSQGLQKTRWAKSLDPINCNAVKEAMLLDLTNKDCIITALSHWIVEIGELDGTIRRTDMARLKSFATSDQDIVRFPYARKNTRIPRRTTFIASVNEPRFLTDTTGNRRWWVVSVEDIDFSQTFDMQQVWAEAHYCWFKGEKPWLDKNEITMLNQQNAEYEMIDPFVENLEKVFDWSEGWQNRNPLQLTPTEVLTTMGYRDIKGKGEPTRMAMILRKYTTKGSKYRTFWLPALKIIK